MIKSGYKDALRVCSPRRSRSESDEKESSTRRTRTNSSENSRSRSSSTSSEDSIKDNTENNNSSSVNTTATITTAPTRKNEIPAAGSKRKVLQKINMLDNIPKEVHRVATCWANTRIDYVFLSQNTPCEVRMNSKLASTVSKILRELMTGF